MVPHASTLKPNEVAIVMVEAAVAKHRTRIDMIFFKGVRLLTSSRDATSPRDVCLY